MKQKWQPWQSALAALAAVLALGGGVAFYAGSLPAPIIVYDEDEPVRVPGRPESVAEALVAAGIELGSADAIAPPLDAPVKEGMAIHIDRATDVIVRYNGEARRHQTRQAYLGPFFAEAGIAVYPGDQIAAGGQAIDLTELNEAPLAAEVDVNTLAAVSVTADGQTANLVTEARTVGQALAEAGVTLYAGDAVSPRAAAWLEPGAEIVVERALALTIQVDGQSLLVRTSAKRPVDVLAEQGIALLGQDYTRPALTADLRTDMTIEVIRVSEAYRFEDESLPFETVWQGTDELELDQRQLLSAGAPGVLRRAFRTRLENGVAVGEEPAGEWVAQPAVNAVMGYGTRVVVRVLETPEGAYEYWRVVRMRATAYTAATSGKPPDHPAYGITASGLRAGTGIVAIDPRVVPFRSWVYVPGYGLGYAGDTGGGVKGRWIDLGYDEGQIVAWNTYVDVYYLVPVPPADKINYLIPQTLP